MAHVQHVRARLPRRRAVRAWVGVLEACVGRLRRTVQRLAMQQLGNGLAEAKHHEGALSVREAELAVMRRIGAAEHNILIAQGNLAITYRQLGRHEEALQMRDVYSWAPPWRRASVIPS